MSDSIRVGGRDDDLHTAHAQSEWTRLAGRVIEQDAFDEIRTVAGADAWYEGDAAPRPPPAPPEPGRPPMAKGERVWASVAVYTFPALVLMETVVWAGWTDFPYRPGYLSFREAPAILEALSLLRTRPDLLLLDGHGRAHPCRFGLACHVGVAADLPAIGVAKTPFVGRGVEPGQEAGNWSPLEAEGERVGAAVRTRNETRPVYVSVGHRVGLTSAVGLVLRCCAGYRLPEPLRTADQLSRFQAAGERP